MANQAVINYIKQTLNQGFSLADITKALLQAGHPQTEIDEAMNFVQKPQLPPSLPNYFSCVKLALFMPETLFEELHDTSVQKSMIYLLITGLLAGILFAVLFPIFKLLGLVPQPPPELEGFLLYLIILGAGLLVFTLGGLIISFVFAGIYHLFAQLFYGKGEFKETYAVVAYSLTVFLPSALLNVIPYIGRIAVIIWQIVILFYGFLLLHKMPKQTALITTFSFYLLLLVTLVITTIIVAIVE